MTAVAALAGLAAGGLAGLLLADVLASAALSRTNRRGAAVATAGGLVVVVAVLAVEAVVVFAGRVGAEVPAATGPGRAAVVVAVLGFGAVGLLDDLVGDRGTRGFRGHLRTLLVGRPSTGAVKLVAGGLVSLVVAGTLTTGPGDLLVAALLVSGCANLGNLLDLAPARTTKVGVGVVVVLVLVGLPADDLWGPVVVLAAAVSLLPTELAERVMLGDTGANAVGAAVGVALAVALGGPGRLAALAAVVALNLAAEVVSFSTVIDRTPPLRWLDRLGRRP